MPCNALSRGWHIHHQHLSSSVPSHRANSEKINLQLPFSDQRRKRLQWVLWAPQFVGSTSGWGIHEAQAGPEHMDGAAQHLGLLHTTHTTSLGKEEFDALKLVLSEPQQAGRPSS